MTRRTPEEIREQHISVMGQELGELYTVLSNKLTWLFWRWKRYVMLFADKPSRVGILNASASFFFWVVQETLWYETLLGISRLAGPSKTMGKDNLSLGRLPELLRDFGLKREVEALLAQVVSSSEFAVEWRNRHIAHRDLTLALGLEQARPLPCSGKR